MKINATMAEIRRDGYDDGIDGNPYNEESYSYTGPQLVAYKTAFRLGKADAEQIAIEDARKERSQMGDQELFNRALDVLADIHTFERKQLIHVDAFPNQKFSPKDSREQAATDLEEVARRLRASDAMVPTHLNYEDI